jgi:hypothetical protein
MVAIHERLITIVDPDAIACSDVTEHWRETKWAAGKEEGIE